MFISALDEHGNEPLGSTEKHGICQLSEQLLVS